MLLYFGRRNNASISQWAEQPLPHLSSDRRDPQSYSLLRGSENLLFVCLLHRVDAPLTFGRSSQQEGEIPDTANQSQRIDLMGLISQPCRFILRKAPLQSGAPGSCRSNFPTPGPSAAPAELSGRSRQIKEMRMGELSVSKLPPNPAGVP